MKVFFLALVGFFLRAIADGVIGIGLGFVWTKVFETTSFEGYSGMLVFLTFMPIGVIVGGMIGDCGARRGRLARRMSERT